MKFNDITNSKYGFILAFKTTSVNSKKMFSFFFFFFFLILFFICFFTGICSDPFFMSEQNLGILNVNLYALKRNQI